MGTSIHYLVSSFTRLLVSDVQQPANNINWQTVSLLISNSSIFISPGVGVLGGQLYAAGGHDGPLVRKSVEVYDPQTNTWRLVCDMNMCRRNAGQTASFFLFFF